jgi:hypothetical protein
MGSGYSIAGIVLIVLGAFALAYQGFTYTRSEEVVDLGPLQVTTQNRETVPLPPILGFLAVAGGIGLLLMDRRRRN